MYDHEIRDVMGRAKHPIVKVTGVFTVGHSQDMLGRRSAEQYRWLELGLHNEGTRLAQYVTAFVSIPYEWLAFPDKEMCISVREIEGQRFAQLTLSNRTAEGSGVLPMAVKIDQPLLPGLSMKVKTVCLVGPPQELSLEGTILTNVFADEAPPRFEPIKVEMANNMGESADDD